MAVANVKLTSDPTTAPPIIWNAAATNYALTLASLTTTATAAWQGAKGDLTEPRGTLMCIRLTAVFTTNPVAGEYVSVYWAGSPASTAASSNPAGATGADASYVGFSTAALAKPNLQFVGNLVLEATTSPQTRDVGCFVPIHRYGMPVVFNFSTKAFTTVTTDHVLTVYPVLEQIQASA